LPVSPSDVTVLNQDGFILAMVAHPFEEDPSSQERQLQGLDVNPDSILVPGECPQSVGDESSKEAIEVEEEED
jgi:hypothetical protein